MPSCCSPASTPLIYPPLKWPEPSFPCSKPLWLRTAPGSSAHHPAAWGSSGLTSHSPSSPVRTGPPPIPQGSWCFPTSSGTAAPPHPHPGSLTVLPGQHQRRLLLDAFSDHLPEGSGLSLSPLSSHRFRIKGLGGILFLPLFTPGVRSWGAKTSLSSLPAKPHPLLLPPLRRQRLPLGEGSCLEISWILLTAQSRRRKRPRRLRSAGGVLTRRPSAGPEPRSVCRRAGVCGWGRGTWQPPSLVDLLLFRFPDVFVQNPQGTSHRAEGWGTRPREGARPAPFFWGRPEKKQEPERSPFVKGPGSLQFLRV